MEPKRNKNPKLVAKGESGSLKLMAESRHHMEITNAVLNNPLLMDKIIKYSIYKPNGKLFDYPTIYAVRLVSKSFLRCASSTFKKSGVPLYALSIDNGSYQKTVNEFLRVFSKTSRSVDSIIPISLEIGQPYFKKGKSKSLRNMFERFGDIITRLWVGYPLDGGSVNVNCDNLSFPILQEFKFKFHNIDEITDRPIKPISDSNLNGLKFLQNILNGSPNLKSFTYKNYNESAVDISSLFLPRTLQKLVFSSPVTENKLALLTKNQLPNLNSLDFSILQQSEVQLMYSILEHFQNQLKTLSIEMFYNEEDFEQHICIRLPSLKKLKVLKLSGNNLSLFPELKHVWSSLVPNLTSIVFKNFPEPVFLEFIQGCEFKNVTSLKLNNRFFLSVSRMSEINSSFPNVQSLSLIFGLRDNNGLQYLFRNFNRLKDLHMSISAECAIRLAGYKVVSTFLGISIEQATALVDKTETNVNVPIDNPDAIMNLTELHSLTLSAIQYYQGKHRKNIVCSEVISRHGLEKMPNLKHINLVGGFEILE